MKTFTVLMMAMFLLSGTKANAEAPTASHTKSKALATSIALGATLVPVGVGLLLTQASGTGAAFGGVLIGAGALFGPSFGRVYADDHKPISMVPLRLGAAGVLLLGDGILLVESSNDVNPSKARVILGSVAVGAGMAMYVASTVIDLVRARNAVDRYNQLALGTRWQLRPAYYSASHAVGANLTLRF